MTVADRPSAFAARCARREDIEILLLWSEGRNSAEIAFELGSNEPLIERRIHHLLAQAGRAKARWP